VWPVLGVAQRVCFRDAGAGGGSQYVGLRLQRIVDFAERVAAGDLTARIASSSTDEIGKVASALDKTRAAWKKVSFAFRPASGNWKRCSTACQDAVIAVGVDGRVQWANHGMDVCCITLRG